MKRLYWYGAALGLMAAILIGCDSNPISTEPTNNSEVKVELMFEHEGCRVYRFYDGGYPIYYTKCDGSYSAAMWDEPHTQGKAVVRRPKEVPTNQ